MHSYFYAYVWLPGSGSIFVNQNDEDSGGFSEAENPEKIEGPQRDPARSRNFDVTLGVCIEVDFL